MRLLNHPPLWLAFASVSLFSSMHSAPLHATTLPTVQFYQTTAYMCGGIGSDQAKVFQSSRSLYPLSLDFGQQQNGKVAFVADVQVVMRDESDTTVVNINSDGPFCLFDIDPGHYEVYVTYEGHTLEDNVTVSKQGHRLSFVWPQPKQPAQPKTPKQTKSPSPSTPKASTVTPITPITSDY